MPQPIIMYHILHTNRDIQQRSLYSIFSKFFLHVHNPI